MKMLIAVTLLAVAASACGGPWKSTPAEREARATKRIESLLSDADVTPEQQQQVLAVVAGVRERFRGERAANKATRAALVAAWNSEAPDEAAVRLAVEEGAARKLADAHAVVDAGVTIHQTLTAEQRGKLEDELPLRRARFAYGLVERIGWGPPASKEELAERAEARFAKVLDELQATDEQRDALRPLLAAVIDDAAPLTGAPATLKDALVATWRSDDGDATALHALIDDEGAQATVAAASAARALVKAHAVLSAEQRAVLATRMQRGGCHGGAGDDDGDGDGDDGDAAVAPLGFAPPRKL